MGRPEPSIVERKREASPMNAMGRPERSIFERKRFAK
jgi:hypothetical protein